MKSIGIITINDNDNYGNRLQNYALQKVLTDLGYDVTTILNDEAKVREAIHIKKHGNYVYKIKWLSKNFNKTISRKLIQIRDRNQFNLVKLERLKNFTDFNQKYIKESTFVINCDHLPEELNSFDYFVAGSDQIWNPHYRYCSPIEFMTFAPSHKRVSYSASFGVSEIPLEYEENYKQWLMDIPNISVREHVGAKIVKRLTGQDVPVHVDPTLLLSKEEWIEVAREHIHKPKVKYILTYFLGELSKEVKKFIKNLSVKTGFEVVNLANERDYNQYSAGPSEYLDYIMNCELLLTNSFHGCVFSMLSDVPFVVFKRGNMNSRIDTFLDTFNLQERKYANIKNIDEVFQPSYSHCPEIIGFHKKRSLEYLTNVLQ